MTAKEQGLPEAVAATKVADILNYAGWRAVGDAQWTRLASVIPELRAALASDTGGRGVVVEPANGREVVAEMVRRFLSWRVPPDFAPDGGISFTPHPYPECWPIGTNLLTEPQAKAMFLQCMPAVAFECMEWKNRALSAEATIERMADEFNRENGRTFMGEPILPAALRAWPAGGGEPMHQSGRPYASKSEMKRVEVLSTPPESSGQGEIVAMVCNAPAFGKGFYQWVKSDAILPIGTKLYPHPPAQASGAVTEAMVEVFCADFWAEQWPSDDASLDAKLRDCVKSALTASLTQGGGNGR